MEPFADHFSQGNEERRRTTAKIGDGDARGARGIVSAI
jgi:hypothetical protein